MHRERKRERSRAGEIMALAHTHRVLQWRTRSIRAIPHQTGGVMVDVRYTVGVMDGLLVECVRGTSGKLD